MGIPKKRKSNTARLKTVRKFAKKRKPIGNYKHNEKTSLHKNCDHNKENKLEDSSQNNLAFKTRMERTSLARIQHKENSKPSNCNIQLMIRLN